MTMNNTPLTWSNETKFVPAKPPEKTMSTYDHLELAEKELRNALRSTTDTTKGYQLRRIVDTINSIEDIKRFFKTEDINTTSEFNFDVPNPYKVYGTESSDTISFAAAQPVNIPGAFGQDVITFS